MKTVIKTFLLIGVVGYLIFAVCKFSGQAEERTCEGVVVEVSDNSLNEMMGEDYIRRILRSNNISPEGNKISSINLQQIEKLIRADTHVDSASCYCTAAGMLCIEVMPNRPVLHVISQKGEDYYVASQGMIMSTKDFNIDLCVATGNVSKQFASTRLLEFATFIHDDLFWREQIQQIHVIDSAHIELSPRVGRHTIQLGSVDNYKDKLHRLRIFYRDGLDRVGWNKYKTINLAYDGQVVCTKANHQKQK